MESGKDLQGCIDPALAQLDPESEDDGDACDTDVDGEIAGLAGLESNETSSQPSTLTARTSTASSFWPEDLALDMN